MRNLAFFEVDQEGFHDWMIQSEIDLKVPLANQVVYPSTIPAMQSGAIYGGAGLVEGIIDRIRAEHPLAFKVVATGGLVDLIASHTDRVHDAHPTLLLEGLRIIQERYPSTRREG